MRKEEHNLQKEQLFFGDFNIQNADINVALQADDLLAVFLSDIIFLFCSCATLNFECKFLGAEPGVISVCKVSRISTELCEQLEYCPINCKAKISSCHNAKI